MGCSVGRGGVVLGVGGGAWTVGSLIQPGRVIIPIWGGGGVVIVLRAGGGGGKGGRGRLVFINSSNYYFLSL